MLQLWQGYNHCNTWFSFKYNSTSAHLCEFNLSSLPAAAQVILSASLANINTGKPDLLLAASGGKWAFH